MSELARARVAQGSPAAKQIKIRASVKPPHLEHPPLREQLFEPRRHRREAVMSRGFDYSKFDKIGDSDESSDDEDWRLTDEERKAKREKKRDELIEKELASHKAIEEKLKRA